jgi:hypothetical protein
VISASLSSRMGAPFVGLKPRRICRPASSGIRGRTSESREKRPRSTRVRIAGMVMILLDEATQVKEEAVKGGLLD